MNEKAQAFSTFQLLISAIVAIAILTILFQVLGLIKPPGVNDPVKAASDVLSAAYTIPASIKTSDGVNMAPGEEGKLIKTAIISATENLGLTADNLCFGEDGDIPSIEVTETSIENTGGSQRKVKFSAICNKAVDLEQTVTDYLENATLQSCPSEGTQRACAVIVRGA